MLDRLNALLEPNGVLSVNERGVIDGQIPTVIPHANFRYIHLLSSCSDILKKSLCNEIECTHKNVLLSGMAQTKFKKETESDLFSLKIVSTLSRL